MIRSLGREKPRVPTSAFVHPSAEVIGKVHLGERVSLWPGVVLRGDIEAIVIGDGSNVQDNAVCHTDAGLPTVVGRNVTVGHGAILHSCRVEDGALIGMGAILLGGCVIGAGSLVGAGALVPPGARIPPGRLALGSPARSVRSLSKKEKADLLENARHYLALARRHRASLPATRA